MSDNGDEADVQPPVRTHAISVKLPQFWESQAVAWFAQAEAQFAIRNVTSQLTQYHHVVTSLSQDVASRVVDLIQSPPAEDPYVAIKEKLLSAYTLSEYQRVETICTMPGLGDRKPSQLMSVMLALCPEKDSKSPFFSYQFLRRLPTELRPHLSARIGDDPRELANYADQLLAMGPATRAPVAAVDDSEFSEDLEQFQIQNRQGRSTSRHPSRRFRSKTPTTRKQCYYHTRFGDLARKCESPCSYQKPQGN